MKKMFAILLLVPAICVLASCARAFVAFSPIPAYTLNPPPPSVAPLYEPQGIGGWTYLSVDGGFKTPEDAVRYFADCLKRHDFPDAAKAFPVSIIAGIFSYLASPERPRVAYMAGSHLPPAHNEPNPATILGQAATTYKSAFLGLYGQEGVAPAIDNASPGLSDLALSMADVESGLSEAGKEKRRADLVAVAEKYGASAAKLYSVTLGAHGNKAVCDALTLVRYDDGWYIASGVFEVRK